MVGLRASIPRIPSRPRWQFERSADEMDRFSPDMPSIRWDGEEWKAVRKDGTSRTLYTISQKREAVAMYRDTRLSVAEIALKMDVPRKTVAAWIRRYQDDAFYVPSAAAA
jgi:DNA-directed RNA polymerase specialized sigma24 family protein